MQALHTINLCSQFAQRAFLNDTTSAATPLSVSPIIFLLPIKAGVWGKKKMGEDWGRLAKKLSGALLLNTYFSSILWTYLQQKLLRTYAYTKAKLSPKHTWSM